MKKLVYTLMFLVGFVTVGFTQEAKEIALTEGTAELDKSKTNGEYLFTFVGKTETEISAAAKYYTHYFNVDFDESSQKASIHMIENDVKARAVIMRFLVVSGVRYADVDGEVISVNDFMMNYLQ
jgi:hypothetical protein